MSRYDDLLSLPHHVSAVHPQMSRRDRAAQFAPFAALVGYDAAVAETARVTEKRPEACEEVLERLDRRLRKIERHLAEHPEITVTRFVPDGRKDGGAYATVTGRVRKLSPDLRTLFLSGGETVTADSITDLSGSFFDTPEAPSLQ